MLNLTQNTRNKKKEDATLSAHRPVIRAVTKNVGCHLLTKGMWTYITHLQSVLAFGLHAHLEWGSLNLSC